MAHRTGQRSVSLADAGAGLRRAQVPRPLGIAADWSPHRAAVLFVRSFYSSGQWTAQGEQALVPPRGFLPGPRLSALSLPLTDWPGECGRCGGARPQGPGVPSSDGPVRLPRCGYASPSKERSAAQRRSAAGRKRLGLLLPGAASGPQPPVLPPTSPSVRVHALFRGAGSRGCQGWVLGGHRCPRPRLHKHHQPAGRR